MHASRLQFAPLWLNDYSRLYKQKLLRKHKVEAISLHFITFKLNFRLAAADFIYLSSLFFGLYNVHFNRSMWDFPSHCSQKGLMELYWFWAFIDM